MMTFKANIYFRITFLVQRHIKSILRMYAAYFNLTSVNNLTLWMREILFRNETYDG